MSKKVLVAVADGSEEIEAVCITDVLRRAGAEVTVASVSGDLQITASRGVRLVADCLIADCLDVEYDLIALPGGMPGAEHLGASTELMTLVRQQAESGRLFAAICAAPAVILEAAGLLAGRQATCHPAFSERLSDQAAIEQRVVVDGNCITSRGPGTAIEFSLKLVALLFGENKAEEVAAPMIV